MADSKQALGLLDLPLEVRHRIFEYVAVRTATPKKLLRHWLERKEASELAAQHVAANPGSLTPVIVYPDDRYDPPDTDDEPDHEYEEDDEEDEDGSDEDDDDGSEDDSDDGGDDEDDEDDGYSQDEELAQALATVTQTQPQAPVFTPAAKWRHVPKVIRISQCLPVEAFLPCNQLNVEAKEWFYEIAVLRIDATGSFAHTSFFEEVFGQIIDAAASSPMKNIRKVEVNFVWDSTWVRTDKSGWSSIIFPALLRTRSKHVVDALEQAPNLREILIHWHDSAQDEESTALKNDVLARFLDLPANVRIEEHYISTNMKPPRASVAGKRRMEFQDIIDTGMQRLV